MTDRDKFIQKKKLEIEKIYKQQINLAAKAAKLAIKQYKTQRGQMRKLVQIALIGGKIKALEIQKHLIVSQPFNKFPKGGNPINRNAIVGEKGKPEIILTTNHLQP